MTYMAFFSRQTVDTIIADIAAKIEQLHVVAELHKAEAYAHDEAVLVRKRLAAEAHAEAERAKAIAQNFMALIEFKKP